MSRQKLPYYCVSLLLFALAACVPAPPVEDSRDLLWRKFGQQSIDSVLLAWGAPGAETRLTDNSRLVTYRHATVFDYGGSEGCKVSFLAHPPKYVIDNIAMQGNGYECKLLAQGRTGTTQRDSFMPPPFYPYYR